MVRCYKYTKGYEEEFINPNEKNKERVINNLKPIYIKLSKLINILVRNFKKREFVINTYNYNYLVSYYPEVLKSKVKVRIVKGRDIEKYYKSKDSKIRTCMSNKYSNLDLLCDESENIRLVIATIDGKLRGRTLIFRKGIKWFHGRVYSTDIFIKNSISKFLLNNKISDVIYTHIKIKLNNKYDKFPYMDDLSFYDKEENTISNNKAYLVENKWGYKLTPFKNNYLKRKIKTLNSTVFHWW